ncbi:MAG: vWA domain-containing protein [Acidimicrobiales bacterium]
MPKEPSRIVVGFARALRRAGLAVPVGSVVTFAEALGHVGIDRRAAVYWAGRATLVRRPEDVADYDRIFASYWLGRATAGEAEAAAEAVTLALDDGDDDQPPPGGDDDKESGEVQAVRWSAVETLRDRDFSRYTPAEWAELQRVVARLQVAPDRRRARRRRPDPRRRHPDLRRTVRRALRTGGEPLERAWRAPAQRPRRLVLLVDVSGSMDVYARALLRFAHAAVVARGVARCEVFTLGTRLTRVTRHLGDRDPDAALRAAAGAVDDWSGGTRLGEALREFNDRWGARGTARGAVVVILSDGWDRGDPEALAEQMARLARVAHRVVWVNPLKASPGYAPLARGMAAALPYVDEFVEGHSLGALEHLAAVVGAAPAERRVMR